MPADELSDLISLFILSAENNIKAIDRYLNEGSLADIARQAHALISSAGNLGAMIVSAEARKTELCALADSSGLATLVQNLKSAVELSSVALRAWLLGLKQPNLIKKL